MNNPVIVEVGQVWRDRDKRMFGRKFQVMCIDGEKAVCSVLNYSGQPMQNRTIRIRLDRFKATSTGYDLITVSGN